MLVIGFAYADCMKLLPLPAAVLSACIILLSFGCATFAAAEGPEPLLMDLYSDEVPGEPAPGAAIVDESVGEGGRIANVHVPTLTVYRPDPALANGAAVVICPGGAYRILASEHEGVQVARWLNDHGVTAVLLKYRLTPYRHPVPMMDVQRAMQTTRANAQAWGIDPGRIGVLGFSAGGHLASIASTHVLAPAPDADDPVLRVTSRPDFAVLLYPVITMLAQTHGGSRNNLLGPDPDDALLALMSNEKQVTESTPPTLLVHSRDDGAVPIANSQLYLAALHEKGVPGTLIEFGTGGHGYGLGRDNHETAAWPGMCIAWMGTMGLLEGERVE